MGDRPQASHIDHRPIWLCLSNQILPPPHQEVPSVPRRRLDMRESATKLPLYTSRLEEELEHGDNKVTILLHARDQDPAATWVGYLNSLMVKVGGFVLAGDL